MSKTDDEIFEEEEYCQSATNIFFDFIFKAKTFCAVIFLISSIIIGWLSGMNIGNTFNSDLSVVFAIVGAVAGIITAIVILTPIACLLLIIDNQK